jgi:hypothetical protein
MQIAIALLSISGAIAIALVATWLFTQRLRRGEKKGLAFREWCLHLLEAVWGL